MQVYKCLWCRKEFEKYENKELKKPKFCSKKCYREAPREWIKPTIVTDEVKKERIRKSFEKYVIKTNACWGWKGSISKDGYGKSSRYFNLWKAHRVSWFLSYGEIPKGKCILHKCDNKVCSNPEHLFLGTIKLNNNDRHRKKRDAKGSQNGNSKLDEKKVKNIKYMLKKGIPQDIIGKEFGIHQTQVSNIKIGKTWRHVSCSNNQQC